MVRGHLVDALQHDIYSTTVKSISMKILQLIAHKADLNILCGNISIAYINAYTNEKVYAIAEYKSGKEIRGKVVMIKRVLYGLRTSSERWHSYLSNTLRIFKFTPARYNNNVWIRLSEDKKTYN